VLLAALVAGSVDAAEKHLPRPNVIIVVADDVGYGDMSFTGNPILKTPNLDKFAKEGIVLDNFHVNPVCSPTRSALMTGRYAQRVGVTGCQFGIDALREGEVTLADVFRHNGYRTGIFGKWHLGEGYPYRPIDRGFDVWFGKQPSGTGHAGDRWGHDRVNDTYQNNGVFEDKPRPGYETDVLFDEAMSFIKSNRQQPFFVYLPTYAGHGPFAIADPKWAAPYGKSGMLSDFYGMMSNYDQNFGRLCAFLKHEGLEQNTIVIYFGDNGTALPEAAAVFNGGMRGQKGGAFEGGHRVFCALRWPAGKLPRPARVTRLTSCLDILPTLTDLCGLKLPAAIKFDGANIRPLLDNPRANWPDRTLIVGFAPTHQYAVMTEQWRLVGKSNGMDMLFDVQQDPGQKNNVAKQNPEIFKRMQAAFRQYLQEVNERNRGWNARPIIGSDHQPVAEFHSMNWHDTGVRAYHQGAVADGVNVTGYWLTRFAQSATYRFEVRRWPADTNAPITGTPPKKTEFDAWMDGKPVTGTLYGNRQPKPLGSIATVRIKVNDTVQEKSVPKNAPLVAFEIPVAAGPATLSATFLDRKGGVVCGAYYMSVRQSANK
jgi:arylsulfatase A-like enzyme